MWGLTDGNHVRVGVHTAFHDADTRSSAHQKMPQAAAMPPFSIRLDVDPAAGEVTVRLDPDSDPVKLVYENGRWTLATDGGSG